MRARGNKNGVGNGEWGMWRGKHTLSHSPHSIPHSLLVLMALCCHILAQDQAPSPPGAKRKKPPPASSTASSKDKGLDDRSFRLIRPPLSDASLKASLESSRVPMTPYER